MATDPVCGMTVRPEAAAATLLQNGETYHFCSRGCLEKFRQDPARYIGGPKPGEHHRHAHTAEHPLAPVSAPALAPPGTGTAQYTCPMHPEIVRDGPGFCPICGMALEPRTGVP